jgi:hypothetical protein
MKNFLSLDTKKAILLLALIVLIILFFLAGLPSKLITSLTGTDDSPQKEDSRQRETAKLADKSKPVVVAKKIPPFPASWSTIVTKKIPSRPPRRPEKEAPPPSTRKLADAGKKKPEPAETVPQAPQKPPPAESQAATGEMEKAPAPETSAAVKAKTTPTTREKVVVAKTKPPKSSPTPAPKKPAEGSKKSEPAALAKVAVTKTKPLESKQESTPRPPSETHKKTAPPLPAENYPYSIMLASCRLKKSAQEVVSQNRKKGLTPHIVKVDLGSKGVWYRVFAGQYKNRDAALKVKKEHNLKDSLIKKTPYVNQIGIFNSEKETASMKKRLEKLGYSPYVIKAQDNTWRLVTGAFVTRDGAKPPKDELAAKGIQSRVVER